MAASTVIAAFFPSVMAKSIFAPRRANKSAEANNAPVSIMNAGVAAVQVAKMGEGVSAIINDGKTVTSTVNKLDNAINLAAKNDSIFNNVKKAVQFGTKHVNVNGMIGGVALLNALYDDNKEKAFLQNGGMFGSMLLAEGAHKLLFGSSKSSRENGVNTIKVDEGYLYKNSETYRKTADKACTFFEKQEEALNDCGKVKRTIGKIAKYVPSAAKGISFAAVSIGGSALGYWGFGKIAETITGEYAS